MLWFSSFQWCKCKVHSFSCCRERYEKKSCFSWTEKFRVWSANCEYTKFITSLVNTSQSNVWIVSSWMNKLAFNWSNFVNHHNRSSNLQAKKTGMIPGILILKMWKLHVAKLPWDLKFTKKSCSKFCMFCSRQEVATTDMIRHLAYMYTNM